jgi:hypothetical protein
MNLLVPERQKIRNPVLRIFFLMLFAFGKTNPLTRIDMEKAHVCTVRNTSGLRFHV